MLIIYFNKIYIITFISINIFLKMLAITQYAFLHFNLKILKGSFHSYISHSHLTFEVKRQSTFEILSAYNNRLNQMRLITIK